MCRNIKPLFNFQPPSTADEIDAASLQFIKKVSGFHKPSKVNEEIFSKTVSEITIVVQGMFDKLETKASPKNREIEAEKLRLRNEKRFAK